MQQSSNLSGGATTTQKQSWMQRVLQHLKIKWDIELTITLAFIAGILQLFGIVNEKTTLGFMLAIFSLIAVSILKNRWTDEELEKTLNSVREHLPAIDDVARSLPNIKIVAEHIPAMETTINSVKEHMPIIDDVAKSLPDIKIVAERLPRITTLLGNLKTYSRQKDAENVLLSYIIDNAKHEDKIQKATIVRYSIHPELVAQLLEQGVEVTIFMQDETTAKLIGSQFQADCISYAYNVLRQRLSEPLEAYPLTIYKYKPPCSIYGIKFDNELICVGWYTYEYTDEFNKLHIPSEDKIQLYGHNRAALIAQKDYEGFDLLDMTFGSIVDNYNRNAQCILRASSQQSQSQTPIPFQRGA